MKDGRVETGKRIFLIDDHPAVRQGLKLLLEQNECIVCGEAACCAETLEQIGASCADLALLDISLGEENGIECIAKLHGRGVPVLVYSMHEDDATIEKALSAGANGYISKREAPEVLLAAMADVLAGKSHIGTWRAGT